MLQSTLVLSCLIFSSYSAVTDEASTYKVYQNFNPAQNTLGHSYQVTESLSSTLCSMDCSIEPLCSAVIYNKKTKACYKFFNETFTRSFVDQSDYILLAKICKANSTTYKVSGCGELLYTDCHQAFLRGDTRHGEVYKLKLSEDLEIIEAVCQFDSTGGWTVLQSRLDGSVDFYRGWESYVAGFVSPPGEYWIGLQAFHYITQTNRKGSIYLKDWSGIVRMANYSTFYIDGPAANYTLRVDGYSGDAGDSLINGFHKDKPFSTWDHDFTLTECPKRYSGAWWYASCHYSNLNGIYYQNGAYSGVNSATGACWLTWKGLSYSYKTIYIRVSRPE